MNHQTNIDSMFFTQNQQQTATILLDTNPTTINNNSLLPPPSNLLLNGINNLKELNLKTTSDNNKYANFFPNTSEIYQPKFSIGNNLCLFFF